MESQVAGSLITSEEDNRSDSRAKRRIPTMNAITMPKLRQISSCLYSKTDSTYSLIVMWSMATGRRIY
ncbi:hypothetical protein PF005_g22253 [Phytophthora fragariae]|uniref:Uncharacterized protein n=1 Tax=Phytophthora fragariae TaxID=53985 RepID=A0A6A3X329_9STRA|nr:hypothetical protein PF009_g23059 [Phytophthora fragariae]KAE8984210.1 hypothetical protein PF011_g20867 [Phytophthora fragariae]KAE9082622.1 hypothetical protein PF007_g22226 [Phytophthora fragariae]KAE9082649.1 hypothetical protein PF010_g21505 [Phytophthora fragariae]KAE9106860.1 hypothetical protein PF006_g21262 [Phytophthora fragariae]